jgi:hypothetical protein
MRKLVLILIAFFALFTFIRAFSSTGSGVVPAVELHKTIDG